MSIESSDTAANPSSKTGWWMPRLAGPVIAAAVFRLALLGALLARGGSSTLTQNDAYSYLEPGRNLLLHGRFAADGVPDLLRTPGYSLFLAITSLAGIPVAAVANVILSVFSVILIWRLGRVVFGDDRIALGAAWIFAFEPISVTYSVFPLSETLFLVLFLLSMERLAEFLRGRRLRVLVAAGLWLTAATFVRPITYYLPVVLALGLFLVLARVPGLRWKAPAVLLVSVLPWLAAWQTRNWFETGYGGFSSVSDSNLYFYVDAAVTTHVEHRSWEDVRKELGFIMSAKRSEQYYLSQPYLAQHPEQVGWNQAQRLAFMHSEALRVIREHYGVYLGSCFTALAGTAFNAGAGILDNLLISGDATPDPSFIHEALITVGPARWWAELIKEYPKTYFLLTAERITLWAVMLGLYMFAARGVFRGGMHNTCLWLLLGTSLYFFAATAVGLPMAGARFRLPVMPVVCILAAKGFRRAKTAAR